MKSLHKIISGFTKVQKELGNFILEADKAIEHRTEAIESLTEARLSITGEKLRAERVQARLGELVGE